MEKKIKKEWLYQFTAKNGEVENKFALKAINRKVRELGEEFYTTTYSKLIRKGILPRAVFKASLENMGKTVSDEKQKQYDLDLDNWTKKSFELEKNRTTLSPSDIILFEGEIAALKEKLVEFQIADFLVYQNTAEAKAQQKTIIWFVLHMIYHEVNSNFEPLFSGEDLEAKLDEYDELSEDEFYLSLLRRVHYLVTIWFLNGINSEEEFAELDKKNIEEENTNLTSPSDSVELVVN